MTLATAAYITAGILLKQWHQHIQERSLPDYIRNQFIHPTHSTHHKRHIQPIQPTMTIRIRAKEY